MTFLTFITFVHVIGCFWIFIAKITYDDSCAPNCITEKWHVLGEICVGIFSIRDI